MESLNYFCDILHAKDFVLQIQCKCNAPPPPSLSILYPRGDNKEKYIHMYKNIIILLY